MPRHRESNFNRLTTCSLAMNISIQKLPVSSLPIPQLPQLLEQLVHSWKRSTGAVCVRMCLSPVRALEAKLSDWVDAVARSASLPIGSFPKKRRTHRVAALCCVAGILDAPGDGYRAGEGARHVSSHGSIVSIVRRKC